MMRWLIAIAALMAVGACSEADSTTGTNSSGAPTVVLASSTTTQQSATVNTPPTTSALDALLEEMETFAWQSDFISDEILDSAEIDIANDTVLAFTLGDPERPEPGEGMTVGAKVGWINSAMNFNESVDARMGRTRALDGTQTAESDIATAWWTYHPDSGLSVVMEAK